MLPDPELVAHANDPPRDKLPPDAQRMRTWSMGQVEMHLSNDNPFDADELSAPLSERMKRATGTRRMPATFHQDTASAAGMTVYSARNATSGSIRAARQAGTMDAIVATRPTANATAM
jgi:hypothetical protein